MFLFCANYRSERSYHVGNAYDNTILSAREAMSVKQSAPNELGWSRPISRMELVACIFDVSKQLFPITWAMDGWFERFEPIGECHNRLSCSNDSLSSETHAIAVGHQSPRLLKENQVTSNSVGRA
jgi:hypothetical protein